MTRNTQTHDETLHPRANDGRFAAKATLEADGGLDALTEQGSRGDLEEASLTERLARMDDVAPPQDPAGPWWVESGSQDQVASAALDAIGSDGATPAEIAADLYASGALIPDREFAGFHFDPDEVTALTRSSVVERQARVDAAVSRAGGLGDRVRLRKVGEGLHLEHGDGHRYALSPLSEDADLRLSRPDGASVADWEQTAVFAEVTSRMTAGSPPGAFPAPTAAKVRLRTIQRDLATA